MALSLLLGPFIINGPAGVLIVLAVAGFGYAAYTAITMAFPADVVPHSAVFIGYGLMAPVGLPIVLFMTGPLVQNCDLQEYPDQEIIKT